jgi:hypothetical protein
MLQGIKFRPYKVQIVQRLLLRDKVAQVEFCNRMLGILIENPCVLNSVLCAMKHVSWYRVLLINKICGIGHQ